MIIQLAALCNGSAVICQMFRCIVVFKRLSFFFFLPQSPNHKTLPGKIKKNKKKGTPNMSMEGGVEVCKLCLYLVGRVFKGHFDFNVSVNAVESRK